jgi:dTDP-4-amino-4,6-dideoxygalactose transaminase
MAKMDQIMEIANQYGLDVIEDSAQSIGSALKGKKSGAYGRVGCFSTHPLKNLNACGDGGFIVTNDLDITNKIKSMRNHGLIDRNVVEEFGFVSRLDSLQALILNYRLSKLGSVIERRRQNSRAYSRVLNRDHIHFPQEENDYFDTHHTFVVQIDKRDEAMKHLLSNGIHTAIHYPIPIHLQPAAKNLGYGLGDFPIAEEQASRIVSLPINQYLKSEEINLVATTLNDFLN